MGHISLNVCVFQTSYMSEKVKVGSLKNTWSGSWLPARPTVEAGRYKPPQQILLQKLHPCSWVRYKEEQRLVRWEKWGNSRIASEEQICSPGPLSTAIMSYEESCLLPCMQQPPAQGSSDPKQTMNNVADRTQLCLDTGDIRGYCKALKAVYRPTFQVQSPLHSADVQVPLTDKAFNWSRWSEQFLILFRANHIVKQFSASTNNQ